MSKVQFDFCSQYYLNNFQKDFIHYKNVYCNEQKSDQVIQFEKYLKNRGLLIIDYMRTIREPKYFEVLSKYMLAIEKKPTILYTSKQLSYISATCEFYAYQIPKNPTNKHFENIYNYLIVHQLRDCFTCKNPNPFYYCVDCGIYTCKSCVYDLMRYVIVGNNELHYLPCQKCKKYNIIYKLPAYYDF